MEPEPAPKGVVKLGKKSKDGTSVPAQTRHEQSNAASSAAE
jgi:hypothetical protein